MHKYSRDVRHKDPLGQIHQDVRIYDFRTLVRRQDPSSLGVTDYYLKKVEMLLARKPAG
jgi:hypothetical protein